MSEFPSENYDKGSLVSNETLWLKINLGFLQFVFDVGGVFLNWQEKHSLQSSLTHVGAFEK